MNSNININELKQRYEVILFDCDGTLVDSMSSHCKAYEKAFAHFNIPFSSEEFYKYAPKGGKILLQKTLLDKGYSSEQVEAIKILKSELIDSTLDEYMVPNYELINLIKEHHLHFRFAVVSNGRRQSIMTILKKLGIIQYMELILTADDYIVSKPYPEPYVKAYTKLNVNPNKCLVFEDNDVGYQSATTAGLQVKMVKI